MTRRRTSFEMDRAYRASLPGFGPDGYAARIGLMVPHVGFCRGQPRPCGGGGPIADDELVNDCSDEPDDLLS